MSERDDFSNEGFGDQPVGGTWSGTGDAEDFTVDTTHPPHPSSAGAGVVMSAENGLVRVKVGDGAWQEWGPDEALVIAQRLANGIANQLDAADFDNEGQREIASNALNLYGLLWQIREARWQRGDERRPRHGVSPSRGTVDLGGAS